MPGKSTASDKPAVRKKAEPSASAPKRHKRAPASSLEAPHEVLQEDIARLAFTYWEQRGYQGGSAEADWFRAEHELRESAPRAGT